jgi:hypothetical protein
MPTYKEWIDGTKVWYAKRSKLLTKVDEALAAYVGDPKSGIKAGKTKENFTRLDSAVKEWQRSKENWESSIRNTGGMVQTLIDAIRLERVGMIGGVSSIGGGGPFVPVALAASVAREARTKETLISQNSAQFSIPTHQRLVYSTGAQDFDWNAVFELTLRRTQVTCTVRIKPTVAGTIVGGRFQSTWKTHLQSAWKGAKLRAGDNYYDLLFDLQFVGDDYAGECYEVEVANPPPPPAAATWQEREQRRTAAVVGQDVGTPHMGQWGGEDAAVIAHEFGHMLGLPDEYLTTQWNHAAVPGKIYNQQPFTTDSLMNNTGKEGRIHQRHYETVRRCFEQWQGLTPNSVEVILKG